MVSRFNWCSIQNFYRKGAEDAEKSFSLCALRAFAVQFQFANFTLFVNPVAPLAESHGQRVIWFEAGDDRHAAGAQ